MADARDKVEGAAGKASGAAERAGEQARGAAQAAGEKAKDAAAGVMGTVKEKVQDVAAGASELVGKAFFDTRIESDWREGSPVTISGEWQ